MRFKRYTIAHAAYDALVRLADEDDDAPVVIDIPIRLDIVAPADQYNVRQTLLRPSAVRGALDNATIYPAERNDDPLSWAITIDTEERNFHGSRRRLYIDVSERQATDDGDLFLTKTINFNIRFTIDELF